MPRLFQSVMVQLGIRQVKSTAYHPQSLEKFHQTLKTYYITQEHDWNEGIPLQPKNLLRNPWILPGFWSSSQRSIITIQIVLAK